MITIALLFTLLGFLSCYHSSKKVKFNVAYSVQAWLKKNPKKANALGVLGMLLGLSFCVMSLGWLNGVIAFSMVLPLVASLIIVLMPLRLLPASLWAMIFLLLFITEIYLS